jgi:hypothetical protein
LLYQLPTAQADQYFPALSNTFFTENPQHIYSQKQTIELAKPLLTDSFHLQLARFPLAVSSLPEKSSQKPFVLHFPFPFSD